MGGSIGGERGGGERERERESQSPHQILYLSMKRVKK